MKFKKSLGQNLLTDKNVLNKIVSLTSFYKKDVIEIGPGTGNLTREILKLKPKSLTCIEKDKNFYYGLKEFYKNTLNFKILNHDILKFNIESLISKNSIIIGNLPYNISTQILVKFLRLTWPPQFSKIIFMFQKEVGEKIIAKAGSPNYSRISIITNSRFKVSNYFFVSKNSFFPKPKVNSIVIELAPINKKDINLKSIKSLEFITNIFFSNRRKMVNKAFKKLKLDDEIFLKNQNIKLSSRPENLTIDQYCKIAEHYEKINS